MKRMINKLFDTVTENVDFVNLELRKKNFKGFVIFNNNDEIAHLTYDEAQALLMLGTQFFCSIVYCLCVKYSIEKY